MIARLDWDSEFFGFPVARVESDSDLDKADELLRVQGYRCAYLLTRSEVSHSAFEPVDVRLEFAWHGERQQENLPDIPITPALNNLAAKAFQDSRFFRDPRFPRDRAQELFRRWLRRSDEVFGFADEAFVTLDRGEQLGLIAVSEERRGEGLGKRLVRAVQSRTDHVTVVTQEANRAAVNLYEDAGFTLRKRDLWYHWWNLS